MASWSVRKVKRIVPETLYGAVARIADDYYPESPTEDRVALSKMRGALRGLADMTCTWAYDDMEDKWQAECGDAFRLEDGTPMDNRMSFCPFCGKRIVMDFPEDGEWNE